MNGNVYRKQELRSFLLSPLSGHILRNAAKKEANSPARNRATLPFAVFKLSRRHVNCCFPSEPSNHLSSVGGSMAEWPNRRMWSSVRGSWRTSNGNWLMTRATIACNKLKKLHARIRETASSNGDVKVASRA